MTGAFLANSQGSPDLAPVLTGLVNFRVGRGARIDRKCQLWRDWIDSTCQSWAIVSVFALWSPGRLSHSLRDSLFPSQGGLYFGKLCQFQTRLQIDSRCQSWAIVGAFPLRSPLGCHTAFLACAFAFQEEPRLTRFVNFRRGLRLTADVNLGQF